MTTNDMLLQTFFHTWLKNRGIFHDGTRKLSKAFVKKSEQQTCLDACHNVVWCETRQSTKEKQRKCDFLCIS